MFSFFIIVFNMMKLLVILFIMKLTAQINICIILLIRMVLQFMSKDFPLHMAYL